MSGWFSGRTVLRRDAPRLMRGAFPFPDSAPVHPDGADDPLNRPYP
jgi:hypothetical protein